MLRVPNRIVGLLFAAVACAATAQFAAMTVGAIVAVQASGSRALTGAPAAVTILGTSLGTLVLGSLMEARGRRLGLAAGWFVGMTGAAAAAIATQMSAFVWLLGAMLLVGIGNGAAQLARYAAADTVERDLRGRAISWIVWAAAVGAILGPLSLEPAGEVARNFGYLPDTGGFAAASVGLLVALLLTRALPAGPVATPTIGVAADGVDGAATARAARVTRRAARSLVALSVAQAAMVMVMAITPVHLADGGHAYGVIGTVMSGHFVGMFALAPVVGWIVDRAGSESGMGLGLVVLAAGSAAAALLPVEHGAVLSAPLLLTGLGWCLCFVSASKVMAVELLGTGQARLQGRVDSLVWMTSATASFTSGFIFAATSYGTVGVWVAGACAAMSVLTLVGWLATRPASGRSGGLDSDSA